jgi:hypothetical protein
MDSGEPVAQLMQWLAYGMEDQRIGVRFSVLADISLLSTEPGLSLGPTQPPIQWVPGALSSGAKRPESDTDDSLPCSADEKTD